MLAVQLLSMFIHGGSTRTMYGEGEFVTLNCSSKSFNAKIVWKRDNQILNNRFHQILVGGRAVSYFTVRSSSRLFNGNYFCCSNVSEGTFCSRSIQLKLQRRQKKFIRCICFNTMCSLATVSLALNSTFKFRKVSSKVVVFVLSQWYLY